MTPKPSAAARAAARPRTKPADVRREELLDGAERLFLEKGIAATSVDDIVAAAEVAKGTFYLHFDSKERLLFALRQRFVQRFCLEIDAAVERRKPEDHPGRLRAFIEAVVTGYIDRAAVHALVFHEFRPEGPPERHENPIIERLAALLSEGCRAGAWDLDVPRLTAVMLYHALHGVFDEAVDARTVDRKRLSRAVEAFYRRALGVPPRKSR